MFATVCEPFFVPIKVHNMVHITAYTYPKLYQFMYLVCVGTYIFVPFLNQMKGTCHVPSKVDIMYLCTIHFMYQFSNSVPFSWLNGTYCAITIIFGVPFYSSYDPLCVPVYQYYVPLHWLNGTYLCTNCSSFSFLCDNMYHFTD